MDSALRASPCVPTEPGTLLPCPFCGGKGEHWHNPPRSYGAICEDCGCEVTSPDNTKDGAIWVWNRRAQQAAPASDTTAVEADAVGMSEANAPTPESPRNPGQGDGG